MENSMLSAFSLIHLHYKCIKIDILISVKLYLIIQIIFSIMIV